VGLAWAAFGRVDIVASASGKIVSSSRTKIIQPFEIGVVRAIHVRDGQSVKAGDVLIELDNTINQADSQHFQGDFVAAQLDVARLTAALSQEADPAAAFHPPEAASATQVSLQRQLLAHQLDEHRAKLNALDRQKAQKEAELGTGSAAVKKLEAVLPVLQERVDIRKTLFAHTTGSKANYLELYQPWSRPSRTSPFKKARSAKARRRSTRLSRRAPKLTRSTAAPCSGSLSRPNARLLAFARS
jgi:hemolysin D